MKVTGYMFQNRLRELAHLRNIAASQFTDALRAFPGDEKPDPSEMMDEFLDAEDATARLQVAQMVYNLNVKVDVLGGQITLAEAIKKVGGAGRAEKMWRSACASKPDRYAYRNDVRSADDVVAVSTVSSAYAMQRAKEAARYASALRQAIAIGNAVERDIDLDPTLFE